MRIFAKGGSSQETKKTCEREEVTSNITFFFLLLKVDLVSQETSLNHKGNMKDMTIRKINIMSI